MTKLIIFLKLVNDKTKGKFYKRVADTITLITTLVILFIMPQIVYYLSKTKLNIN